jgi:hypothetical protein
MSPAAVDGDAAGSMHRSQTQMEAEHRRGCRACCSKWHAIHGQRGMQAELP